MQNVSHEDTQLVTLGVGGEVFGIEVSAVREILDFQDITPLPYAPPYILGMINVRGSTVPVVDLRTKLNLPQVEATGFTRILVLEVQREERRLQLGLVADRVFEVAELDAAQMEPPPDIGVQWRSDYIKGVGRRGDSFVVVFDLERLFSGDEAVLIAQNGQEAA